MTISNNTIMTNLQRRIQNPLLFFATCTLISSCSILGIGSKSENVVSIALLPASSPELIRENFTDFNKYLEKRLGKKVELTIPTTYQGLKTIVNKQQYDVAQLNPVLYAMNYNPETMESFATELDGGETSYRSVFIVKTKSPYWNIRDLKGKTIGFNNTLSTSGYIIPRYMLYLSELHPSQDYSVNMLGSHKAATNAVINGTVDAAAVSWKTLEGLISGELVKGDDIRIIEVSMSIPNDVWILRKSLDSNLKNKLRKIFFNVKNNKAISKIGVDGFVPLDKESYTLIKQASESLSPTSN